MSFVFFVAGAADDDGVDGGDKNDDGHDASITDPFRVVPFSTSLTYARMYSILSLSSRVPVLSDIPFSVM